MAQIKKEEVKKRIISNAKREFLAKGFKNASIRSIAKKANITSGTIYTYFKNKNDLYESIIGTATNALFYQMEKRMDYFKKHLGDGRDIFTMKESIQSIENLIALTFLYHDEFEMLLIHSGGSSFDRFKSVLVKRYTELTCDMLDGLYGDTSKKPTCSVYSIHIILSIFIAIVEEIIYSAMTKDEASSYKDEWASIVFGAWHELVGRF